MSRSSLLLSLAALMLLAGGGLTLASSSAATGSSRVIVCPVARGVIIPCCGPPVVRAAVPVQPIRRAMVVPAPPPIDCCPPNAVCASSLTIESSPNPSSADRGVAISGQLLGATTVGLPVVLWERLPGQSQFQQMLKTTTDATGKYKISRSARQVQTDREWYATAGTMRSVTLTQEVEAIVTLAATAGTHGSTIFAGRVRPSHKGQRILLQRHTSHGWLTIARPRLTRASSFTVRHRLTKGMVELQAVLPADSQNVRSASAPLTVRSR